MHYFFPTKKHLALKRGKLNCESPGVSRESLSATVPNDSSPY